MSDPGSKAVGSCLRYRLHISCLALKRSVFGIQYRPAQKKLLFGPSTPALSCNQIPLQFLIAGFLEVDEIDKAAVSYYFEFPMMFDVFFGLSSYQMY